MITMRRERLTPAKELKMGHEFIKETGIVTSKFVEHEDGAVSVWTTFHGNDIYRGDFESRAHAESDVGQAPRSKGYENYNHDSGRVGKDGENPGKADTVSACNVLSAQGRPCEGRGIIKGAGQAPGGNEMKLKNELAIVMARKKIKIKQLSQMTGISRTTLTSIYYNREKVISYAVIEKLCQALECSLNDLIIPS